MSEHLDFIFQACPKTKRLTNLNMNAGSEEEIISGVVKSHFRSKGRIESKVITSYYLRSI